MKLNFNVPFKDYKGEVIKENGKDKKISEMIASLLFVADGITKNDDKMKAFNLSQRIYTATNEIEITVEEAAMIKKVAEKVSAGGYAQIINLIESK